MEWLIYDEFIELSSKAISFVELFYILFSIKIYFHILNITNIALDQSAASSSLASVSKVSKDIYFLTLLNSANGQMGE